MPIPQFTAGQVLTAAELNAMVDAINAGGAVKVERFTASGTWTVPTGVTYAVATILGGGGGSGTSAGVGGQGGTSSVAFASGTVSATGGLGAKNNSDATPFATAGQANSGQGATITTTSFGSGSFFATATGPGKAQNGTLITAGADVTPAASITVTVGDGGTAGSSGAAGGSGYVYIEYQGG
jgi:hypothetical protein